MKKKKYDTSVIMLYLLGQEKLLPKEFRQKIPYSTISSWRKVNYENYEGSQFRFLFDDNWDVIRLKHENKSYRSILRALIKCHLMLRGEIDAIADSNKNDALFKSKVVSAINLLKPVMGLKVALKLFSLHKTQYYEWSIVSKNICTHSFNSLCLKRFPKQLDKRDVGKIKRMLTSPKYSHWPIVSIAALGLRKGNVVASLYTWYKYARLLNITHEACRKTGKLVGLIADKPNQYFHIDTTYYQISEAKKVCITFIMDNYSKMILGFAVNEKLCFDLIREAIVNALITISKHEQIESSFLVCDGGKENNNKQIEGFISEITSPKLTKIRALKDIQFSNSPIEAIHKIMKGRYIRNRKFQTIDGLIKFLTEAVYDYNYSRPHYKHFPKTPSEAYFGNDINFSISKRLAKAMDKRIKSNQTTTCNVCRKASSVVVNSSRKTSSPIISSSQYLR